MSQNRPQAGTIYNQRLKTRSSRKASGDLNSCLYVSEDNLLNFHNASFRNADVCNHAFKPNFIILRRVENFRKGLTDMKVLRKCQ